MSRQRDVKKGPGYNWRVLLYAALAGAAWIVWNYPRTGWSPDAEPSRRLTAVAPEPASIRNIVLISIDTLRADHLGCYGYSRDTSPNIDAVATDGVLFNHTVAPVPITLPSHSSMLTGKIPPYHKVRDNNDYRLDQSHTTLAEILQSQGYSTAAFVSSFVLDSQFGLDQGFDTYEDKLGEKQKNKGTFTYNERNAEDTTLLVNRWLDMNRSRKFFMFVHYFDPHAPYIMHDKFKYSSFAFLGTTKDHYDSEISHTDYYIGRIVKKLKELGLYDSTLLIITSDHGEGLGQHNEKSHAYFIYHSTLHVPLIMKFPGGPKGVQVNDLTGLIDIVPTVCGSLGIPAPKDIQGLGLNDYIFKAAPLDKERYIYCESLYPTKFGLGPFFGMVNDRWKYIHTSLPDMFDLIDDPYERNNVFEDNQKQASLMRAMIASKLKGDGFSGSVSGRSDIDEQTRKRLGSLGYVTTSSVKEDVSIEQELPNPKEEIEVFRFHEQFLDYSMSGEFVKAKRLCNKMLSKHPEISESYFYLGLVAGYEKDIDAAISNYTRYINIFESNTVAGAVHSSSHLATAHKNIGVAYQQKGMFDKAIEHHQKSLSYVPDKISVILSLAWCYVSQKKVVLAIDQYVKALELDPDQDTAIEDMKNIAGSLLRGGYTLEAIDCLKHVLRFRPQDLQAGYELAKAEKLLE